MKINAKNGFDIRFIKNNTYALLVTFNDIEEDLRSAYFTVKENPEDATPVLQKSLGAGIAKVDDRAYKKEKKYKLQLQSEDTTPLEADVQYLYDFQVTIGNVVKTIASGLFVVSPTITGDKVITTQEIVAEVTDELDTEFATVEATTGIEYEQDPVANAKIGDLTALETTNKESVVNALNEVKNGVESNSTALNSEVTARQQADNELSNQITEKDAQNVKKTGESQTVYAETSFAQLKVQSTMTFTNSIGGKGYLNGGSVRGEQTFFLPNRGGTIALQPDAMWQEVTAGGSYTGDGTPATYEVQAKYGDYEMVFTAMCSVSAQSDGRFFMGNFDNNYIYALATVNQVKVARLPYTSTGYGSETFIDFRIRRVF